MAHGIEAVIRHMITQNNHNMNISFPAVVVNTDRLVDGFIDVKPIVNYTNPLTRVSYPYPTIQNVRVIFPSSITSTICFPVNQGDFVELLVQSVDIQSFINGNEEQHESFMLAHGNLSNVVAYVGFTPYQKSCHNPNNYKGEFDNQDLNIVHNKNTSNEVMIALKTDGEVVVRSPTKVKIECKEVELLSDRVTANNAIISTSNDVMIGGKSVKAFMSSHTHIGNKGTSTSIPQGL